jgi:hypothetical protein
MSTIFQEDLNLFLEQANVIVVHNMHLLLEIVQQDSRELSIAGAEALLKLVKQASVADLQHIKESFQIPFTTAVRTLMSLAFVKEVKHPVMMALMRSLACLFAEERDQLLIELKNKFPEELQPEIRIHVVTFVSRLGGEETPLSEALVKESIGAIIGFARDSGVELSFN